MCAVTKIRRNEDINPKKKRKKRTERISMRLQVKGDKKLIKIHPARSSWTRRHTYTQQAAVQNNFDTPRLGFVRNESAEHHRLSSADDDERLRGRYGRTPAVNGGAGLDGVLGLGASGICPADEGKDGVVGESTLMIDDDDPRRETYGRGGGLSTTGVVGCGDAGASCGGCCDCCSGISMPNWSVTGRGGGRSTIASRSSFRSSSPAYSPSISSGPRSTVPLRNTSPSSSTQLRDLRETHQQRPQVPTETRPTGC